MSGGRSAFSRPLAAAALWLSVATAAAQSPDSRSVFAAGRASLDRGVKHLLQSQNKDGSWGGPRRKTMTDTFANAETHEAWTVGTTGLAIDALLTAGGAEGRAAALRGVERLSRTAANLKRCADWDIDNVWGYVYGLQGLARALREGEAGLGAAHPAALAAARAYLKGLADYQSPNGGWGYYADAEAAWRPEWATSFTTAAAVLAMTDARAAGLTVPPSVYDAAVKALDRCRMPDFAYTYDVTALPSRRGGLQSINHPRASLGRTQVCGLARFRAGRDVSETERRAGVARFFEEHAFLDCALKKPIPHESWYANAAYFYLFGHYYAARMIETLPAAERAGWYAQLVPHVVKTQEPDGGMWDFYISSHTKPYGSAFGVLALDAALKSAPKT